MEIQARAKINLTLDVLGKREDDYHELASIMQSLEHHDILLVEPYDGDILLSVEGHSVSDGPDNLVYKAAELLRGTGEKKPGARIHLRKNIPVAAGLGGGSADAAAAMLALNKVWDLNYDLARLLEIGARVGSDVPFCLVGGTALVKGAGERVTPLTPLPPVAVTLVKPAFEVSTAKIYQMYDRFSISGGHATEAMQAAIEKEDLKEVARLLANDLESVTGVLYPQIQEIKNLLLQAGALGALMTGSGPTVAGLFDDDEAARKVQDVLGKFSGDVIITRTA